MERVVVGPGPQELDPVHVDAVRQLQHDTCLMTSNLNVVDQYTLSLQGTASELL